MALTSIGFAQSKDALVGTWKLMSATDTTDKGETKAAFGQDPTGFLTYTADGRMMAIIADGARRPLSVPDNSLAPAEERAEAFATFRAYAGRYTVEAGKVIHHVEISSIQNRVGTDLTRSIVTLQGDRLVLRTPPQQKGGAMITTELIWQRLKEGASAR
jgi:hypothetical protein